MERVSRPEARTTLRVKTLTPKKYNESEKED